MSDRFRLLGGHPALDFVNTVGGRTHATASQYEVERITWDDGDALDRPLWEVSRAAAALLTSDELSRVRQCGGESCGWLFLDTSRNRSRQWCDMADCGNIAKVRRFRERARNG